MRIFKFFILFFIAFSIFLLSSAPSITLIDSGELIISARCLGNPHSPGYPVFTQIAYLATLLPIGNIAYRMAILSAFMGAMSIFLFGLILNFTGFSFFTATVCALIFSFSRTFWSQSIMAEVYTLLMTLIEILCLIILFTLKNPRNFGRNLYLFSFIIALSLGVHHSVIFIIPSIIILLLNAKQKANLTNYRRIINFCAIFFIIGFSAHLYLPIRASLNGFYHWEKPQNFSSFINLITTKTFNDQRFVRSKSQFMAHLDNFAKSTLEQFTPYLIWLPLTGMIILIRKSKLFFLTTYLYWLIVSIIGITYFNLSERWFCTLDVFFIPAFWIMSIWSAVFLEAIFRYLRKIKPRMLHKILLFLIAITLPSITFSSNYAHNFLEEHYFVYDWGKNMLTPLPYCSILVLQSDEIYVLWYLQAVEKYRDDVASVHYLLLITGESWLYEAQYRIGIHINWDAIRKSASPLLHLLNNHQDIYATFKDWRIIPANYCFIPIGINYQIIKLEDEMPKPKVINLHFQFRNPPQSELWVGSAEREYLDGILSAFLDTAEYNLNLGDCVLAKEFSIKALNLRPSLLRPYQILKECQ